MPNSNEFFDFLKSDNAALADLAKVIKKFLEVHGEVPTISKPSCTSCPRKWEEGEKHELTTIGLNQADLASLIEASADAAVIDKFLSELKGFISGVMLKGFTCGI